MHICRCKRIYAYMYIQTHTRTYVTWLIFDMAHSCANAHPCELPNLYVTCFVPAWCDEWICGISHSHLTCHTCEWDIMSCVSRRTRMWLHAFISHLTTHSYVTARVHMTLDNAFVCYKEVVTKREREREGAEKTEKDTQKRATEERGSFRKRAIEEWGSFRKKETYRIQGFPPQKERASWRQPSIFITTQTRQKQRKVVIWVSVSTKRCVSSLGMYVSEVWGGFD